MTLRVLLVDDHRLVRETLRGALLREPDLHVVGEVGEGLAAVDFVRDERPDVVVLDIGLPDLNGVEVAERIRELDLGTAVVALSAYADKRFALEMFRAGALGYVTKSAAATELVHAIRAVGAGQTYVSPDLALALVADMRAKESASAASRLGRREREVLRLIAEGARSAEIAEQLHISLATVEVHRRNIMRKLELRNVAELTRYAIREGLISP